MPIFPTNAWTQDPTCSWPVARSSKPTAAPNRPFLQIHLCSPSGGQFPSCLFASRYPSLFFESFSYLCSSLHSLSSFLYNFNLQHYYLFRKKCLRPIFTFLHQIQRKISHSVYCKQMRQNNKPSQHQSSSPCFFFPPFPLPPNAPKSVISCKQTPKLRLLDSNSQSFPGAENSFYQQPLLEHNGTE